MLPSTGWLSEAANTGGNPIDGPLPVEYAVQYTDGGTGVVLGATDLPLSQVAALFELSFLRETFGYGTNPVVVGQYCRVLAIELVQAQVFGVLLLDSFTPPAISNEFFEFDAYMQTACDGGDEGAVPIYGLCAAGTDVPFDDTESTTPVYVEA